MHRAAWCLIPAIAFAGCAVGRPGETRPAEADWKNLRGRAVEAMNALNQGHYARAEEALTATLKEMERLGVHDGTTAEFLVLLGTVYLAESKYDEAKSVLEHARRLCEGLGEPADRVRAPPWPSSHASIAIKGSSTRPRISRNERSPSATRYWARGMHSPSTR